MDATFYVALAFVCFAGVLFYFKVPGMLTKGLDERAEKIKSDLEKARQLKEEAQALVATYERKQREAVKEAEEMVAYARQEAEREAKEAAEKLEEVLARRQQQALEKIALAEAQAEKEVRDAAIEIAIAAASRVIAEHAKGDAGSALIDQATQDLRSQLNN
jgi:F-type H+-transporting ATPase subunit b